MDHSYDPVPGEPPLSPMPDYELGTPYTWFEYEMDNRLHSIMVHDQVLFIYFIFSNSYLKTKDHLIKERILIALRIIGDHNKI